MSVLAVTTLPGLNTDQQAHLFRFPGLRPADHTLPWRPIPQNLHSGDPAVQDGWQFSHQAEWRASTQGQGSLAVAMCARAQWQRDEVPSATGWQRECSGCDYGTRRRLAWVAARLGMPVDLDSGCWSVGPILH